MSLQFDVFDQNSGAFSAPNGLYEDRLNEFDSLLDAHQAGQLGDKPYVAWLVKCIADLPDFIDPYAYLAMYWQEIGKPKKALELALAGLSMANRLIPEGFHGTIEWGHLTNRPYLRALHVALLSYIRLRRHKDAVTMIELMIARNPNDHQGVRYLLGSEALRAGQEDKARQVLCQEADGDPACYYELALCDIRRGEWVLAATALRRGFVSNGYIAECLCGNPNPPPLAIWHGSNLAEPEMACQYVQMYGGLWSSNPDGRAFLRWLWNHPKVMMERAAILGCQEAMLWEPDGSKRVHLGEQQRALIDQIDDDLSKAIVTKRENRRNRLNWPWRVG